MYAIEELIGDTRLFEELGRSLTTSTPPPALREAKIKLTSRCNLRCHMCRYWHNHIEDALPTRRWMEVLTELRSLGGRKVHFSGGEVFLRRDFLDLAEHAVDSGMKVNLTTNGTLLDRERAKRLARAGVNSISISIDGPTSRTHDAIRGVPGAFRRSVRAVRWLVRYGQGMKRPPKVRVNFVVMSENFRQLPDMVALAARLGATDLHPMPVDEKADRKRRLSRHQIERYNRDVAPRVLELRQRHGFSTQMDKVHPFGVTPEEIRLSRDGHYARGFYDRRPCLAPWLHTFVAWNGDVFLCCMTNGRIEPLGNVGRESVRDVFQGDAYQRVRAAFMSGQQPPACQRCDLFLHENSLLHAALGEKAGRRRTPAAGAA